MLIAHGGGAPEALAVVLPIVIFTAYLYVERRNRRRDAASAAAEPAASSQPEVGDEPPRPA